MTTPHLPSPDGFAELVGMLVGKRVRATRAPWTGQVFSVATYVDAAGKVAYVALADVALIASMGAALAMIPAEGVRDAIKSGKPSSIFVENAYEVLNVAASLFNDEDASVHVKVTKLELAPLPDALVKRIGQSGARADFVVEIPGYPNARVSFVAVKGE